MQVETVDYLVIPTRDIARAVAWYCDVLGLEPGARGEVETPNVTLSFWNPEEDGEEFVSNTNGFGLRVADVGEARRELEGRGVEFLGDTVDSGVCHMAFLRDPDGNPITLHRRYAPRD
jgi:catechol 2,3-dioxygenase-like lactoylglutathione lyase family enzyme